MVKVTYPDGHAVNFTWKNKEYGFIRRGKKILRFPLPKHK